MKRGGSVLTCMRPFGIFGRAREVAAISATMEIRLDLAPSLTQLELDQLRDDYLYRCCSPPMNFSLKLS